MKKTSHLPRRALALSLLCTCALGTHAQAQNDHGHAPKDALRQGFAHPPAQARLRCYWWWLNGHTDKATITRDLEEMAKMGYGGALLVDANGAAQNDNDPVPAGPQFGSPAWTELYVHALKEADRLGLEITLNITSGWNLGGPKVTPEQASKILTWSRVVAEPGAPAPRSIAMPAVTNGFYRQIAVLAYPLHQGVGVPGSPESTRHALRGLRFKSASSELGFSMPATDWLLDDPTLKDTDSDTALPEVQDISDKVSASGEILWTPPAGSTSPWEILRIGYTDSDAHVSTSSDTWQGLAIDYLDPTMFDLYWDSTVQPLLQAAQPYVGKSLKYVATDSWELGGTNWTRDFREQFTHRRGYDPVVYLPIVAGRIVQSRDTSMRFLADLRRTVGDLVNTHYDRMAERARPLGLGTQCESGGPHGAPFDALETFRSSAIPQTEFWAISKEHRTTDSDRFFVKEASSAAHIYGRPMAAAEGETSIGNHWSESIGMNLRPSFDRALTEGMNRLVWHEFTSSPASLGLPGQEYFAGTHLNPNVTWWHVAGPFLEYLNRSQFLMQQGQPVSDLLYYYGDNVPNFVRLKSDDPAHVLPGYDYDVTDTDALLQRITFADGTLQTPEGIHYRALALPASHTLSLTVLRWMERYVSAGGNLIGTRPQRSEGVVSASDEAAFQALIAQLWQPCEANAEHTTAIDKGHLYCTANAREAFAQMHLLPDVDDALHAKPMLDYVHRATSDEDIYFLRNTSDDATQSEVLLRAEGGRVDLFHADTGAINADLLASPANDGRTRLPLTLAPHTSIFVVVRHHASAVHIAKVQSGSQFLYDNTRTNAPAAELEVMDDGRGPQIEAPAGSYAVLLSDNQLLHADVKPERTIPVPEDWTLSFTPGWGAPASINMKRLEPWDANADPGIRFYSGSAVYRTTLTLTAEQIAEMRGGTLDLGEVHEVASVKINGKPAGIVWKQPYAVETAGLLRAGANQIEIEVTNLWPNRIIGDLQDPAAKHYTWTNIRAYRKDSPLLPSGLLGPVGLHSSAWTPVH